MIVEHIFREYDIRGLVETDLTEEAVNTIAKGYGTLCKKEGINKMVIGGDCRLSSPMLMAAASDGLRSTGISIIDLGIVPTPVLYYSLYKLDVGGGMMVTGSHNPPEYNGLKIAKGKKTIFGNDIRDLYSFVNKGEFEKSNGSYEKYQILDQYIEEIISKIKLDKSIKAIVDAGNGTAGPVVPVIFRELGAEVKEMYTEMDGKFPNHHPDPTVAENLIDSINIIKQGGWDLITAFDGDSDRVGAVDEKGDIVWGDILLALFAREILKTHKDAAIIGEVKCSQVLYDDIKKHGGRPIMWKTGHSLIKEKMKAENALLAGEMSGHLFFADDYYGYDDAIYASARLLQLLSRTDSTLSELAATLPQTFSTPEIKIDTSEEMKWSVTEKVKEYFKKSHETIDIDGVRVIFEDGWGLVRPSNTTPVIVTRFEATSEKALKEIQTQINDKINEFL